MVLIFGGTTEGRLTATVLEEAGKTFYYSTRGDEQEVTLHHGIRLCGSMNASQMEDFCRSKDIRLLIDAAHPFATLLHTTIHHVSQCMQIPVIRYERIYPDYDAQTLFANDYDDAARLISTSNYHRILALTGVQTIGKLRPLWQGKCECYFRILRRPSSQAIAQKEGFPEDYLCYYDLDHEEDAGQVSELLDKLHPDLVLTKESGISGGFEQKSAATASRGIPLLVIRRPPLPDDFITVNGPHGLRRETESLLPGFFDLRTGITTGTCATAGACAALRALLCGGYNRSDVPVLLPNGESIRIAIKSIRPANTEGQGYTATVTKDGGDDADVTHGHDIGTTVVPYPLSDNDELFLIEGGKGVGRVSLPGLGLAVGQAAINNGPRQMIIHNLHEILRRHSTTHNAVGYRISISVPDGEKLAAQTFNPRIGVVGGISIIGTSGIVRPFSTDAFIASIRKALEVAKATGSERVVINSGARSERFLRNRYPDLPLQAFVHYGNFIGDTLKMAAEHKLEKITLGLMLGKAVKLAEGHLNTHSKQVVMNKTFLTQVAQEAGCSSLATEVIEQTTLARELWSNLPTCDVQPFCNRILHYCHRHCDPLLPNGQLTILLIDEQGNITEDIKTYSLQ